MYISILLMLFCFRYTPKQDLYVLTFKPIEDLHYYVDDISCELEDGHLGIDGNPIPAREHTQGGLLPLTRIYQVPHKPIAIKIYL